MSRFVMEAIAVRERASDGEDASAGHPNSLMPHMLVITADSLQTNASLIAPAEGAMRFIASSPALMSEAQRGIPQALDRLAPQCGYAIAAEMMGAAVLSGPPITVQVVGERSAEDAAAIALAERFGVARVTATLVTPPRNPARHRSWFQPIIDAWQNGYSEVLLIIVPPGALPQWAAQLFTALGYVETSPCTYALVIASDSELAAALPTSAMLIPRDEHFSSHLTATLNRSRAASAFPHLADTTPLFSHAEALSAALRAVSAHREKPCMYLDVSDGTTIIIADGDRATVYHDPDSDFSRGAMRLVHDREPAGVTRWIPAALDTASLRRWAARRASWPMALLTDAEDRAIAAALARACLTQALERVLHRIPDEAIWLLGPAVTRLGSAAVLGIVADLIGTARVAVVACDGDDLLPAIGALSLTYPANMSDLLLDDAVEPVGSVVRTSFGTARGHDGDSVQVTNGEGRTHTMEVAGNALTTIAVRGSVTLRFTGQTTAGDEIDAEGGAGGILIDTRRRPLTAAARDPARPNVSRRLRPAVMESAVMGENPNGSQRVP